MGSSNSQLCDNCNKRKCIKITESDNTWKYSSQHVTTKSDNKWRYSSLCQKCINYYNKLDPGEFDSYKQILLAEKTHAKFKYQHPPPHPYGFY